MIRIILTDLSFVWEGDANNDDCAAIADVVIILQTLGNPKGY